MPGEKLKESIGQLRPLKGKASIRLPRQHSKPYSPNLNAQYRTHPTPHEGTDQTGWIVNSCANCKQAVCSSGRVFCAKLREDVGNIVECHYFELEPLEYRLFIRT